MEREMTYAAEVEGGRDWFTLVQADDAKTLVSWIEDAGLDPWICKIKFKSGPWAQLGELDMHEAAVHSQSPRCIRALAKAASAEGSIAPLKNGWFSMAHGYEKTGGADPVAQKLIRAFADGLADGADLSHSALGMVSARHAPMASRYQARFFGLRSFKPVDAQPAFACFGHHLRKCVLALSADDSAKFAKHWAAAEQGARRGMKPSVASESIPIAIRALAMMACVVRSPKCAVLAMGAYSAMERGLTGIEGALDLFNEMVGLPHAPGPEDAAFDAAFVKAVAGMASTFGAGEAELLGLINGGADRFDRIRELSLSGLRAALAEVQRRSIEQGLLAGGLADVSSPDPIRPPMVIANSRRL